MWGWDKAQRGKRPEGIRGGPVLGGEDASAAPRSPPSPCSSEAGRGCARTPQALLLFFCSPLVASWAASTQGHLSSCPRPSLGQSRAKARTLWNGEGRRPVTKQPCDDGDRARGAASTSRGVPGPRATARGQEEARRARLHLEFSLQPPELFSYAPRSGGLRHSSPWTLSEMGDVTSGRLAVPGGRGLKARGRLSSPPAAIPQLRDELECPSLYPPERAGTRGWGQAHTWGSCLRSRGGEPLRRCACSPWPPKP